MIQWQRRDSRISLKHITPVRSSAVQRNQNLEIAIFFGWHAGKKERNGAERK